MQHFFSILGNFFTNPKYPPSTEGNSSVLLGDGEATSYWSSHNVTLHHTFNTPEESLEYFHWRNDQYFGYIDLMPVSSQDGKVVLDYGCGPGHDLVGFATYSKPARIVGIDVSPTSLAEAEHRLRLHGIQADLVQLSPSASRLPIEDASIDYVHSSGVLHHTPDPLAILRELHRTMKPGAQGRIMIYNRDSLWLHLYVAYQKMLVEGAYTGLDLDQAFARSTDGEDCPISRCYRPQEFVDLLTQAGFEARFAGAAVSVHEVNLFNTIRFAAIQDRRLPPECRRFLAGLQIDRRGLPVHGGTHAGVDACFHVIKP